MKSLNFEQIKLRANNNIFGVINWLGLEGRQEGQYFVALNPNRSDTRLGSFKINLQNGLWKDFALDDASGDIITLTSYILKKPLGISAKELAQHLGMEV